MKDKKQYMIHIYKQDANLVKTIEKQICIHEDATSWIFFSLPFKSELIREVIDSSGEKEKSFRFKRYSVITNKYPIFLFFWKDRWFNLSLTLNPENNYIISLKISSPPLKEESALKCIDFDLTMKLKNHQELSLLNSDSHIANCTKFKYSKNLQKEISKAIRTAFVLLKNNWFERFTKEEFISSLWSKVVEQLNTPKEELLVKKEDKNTVERLEVDEFE